MSAGVRLPEVFVWNRQRAVPLEVKRLQAFAEAAVPLCLKLTGGGESVLSALAEVEIVLVSDRVIARVHRRFMEIPGATDVITFEHGEIVVSATTAQREAAARGEAVQQEILRYIVHGLLHLNGHEDARPADAAAMWKAQESVLAQLCRSERAS